MAHFKAVLFDFDGVIVDSTPTHLDGWAAAYGEVFQKQPEAHMLASLMGRSTVAIAALLAEKEGRPETRASLIEKKGRYVLEHVTSIPLIPGIAAFMEKLVTANIPYGIASNSPRGFLEASLQHHGLPYSFFLGAEDYAQPKPDPEAYLLGGKRLGLAREDYRAIAVFEDSTHGIEAALGARMTAIGVGSQHPVQVLIEAGAHYGITDFREVAFLDRYFS